MLLTVTYFKTFNLYLETKCGQSSICHYFGHDLQSQVTLSPSQVSGSYLMLSHFTLYRTSDKLNKLEYIRIYLQIRASCGITCNNYDYI